MVDFGYTLNEVNQERIHNQEVKDMMLNSLKSKLQTMSDEDVEKFLKDIRLFIFNWQPRTPITSTSGELLR